MIGGGKEKEKKRKGKIGMYSQGGGWDLRVEYLFVAGF